MPDDFVEELDEELVDEVRGLEPPAWFRAIARRAVDPTPDVVAVSQGNMTSAMWVDVRDVLRETGNTLWGGGFVGP